MCVVGSCCVAVRVCVYMCLCVFGCLAFWLIRFVFFLFCDCMLFVCAFLVCL